MHKDKQCQAKITLEMEIYVISPNSDLPLGVGDVGDEGYSMLLCHFT